MIALFALCIRSSSCCGPPSMSFSLRRKKFEVEFSAEQMQLLTQVHEHRLSLHKVRLLLDSISWALRGGTRGICGFCGSLCRFCGLQCLYKPQKPAWAAAYLRVSSAHNLLPTSISNSADFSIGTGDARVCVSQCFALSASNRSVARACHSSQGGVVQR